MIENSDKWPAWKKFTFLFILSYSFFYIFPFPLDAISQLDFFSNRYGRLHDGFVYWSAKNLFHIPDARKLAFSDSGDTVFDFAAMLIYGLLSLLLSAVVTLTDRSRPNYEKLRQWLTLYIRYAVAFYMLVYGFDKVFKSHFPFPSLEKLEQPFGQSTPQGLLWAFMGYSTPYTMYLGFIEVLSGFLLFFKRTFALGAILALIIMINVTIINFSYDVPVKLFALHLVAYSLLLCSPLIRPLWTFFVLHRQSELQPVDEPEYPSFIRPCTKWIKGGVVIGFTLLFMNFSIINMRTEGDDAPKPPLYGTYNYENSTRHERDRIEQLIFDRKVTLIKWKHQYLYFDTKVDTVSKIIHLRSNSDPSDKRDIHYDIDIDLLTLFENDSTSMQFRKVNLQRYPLINRGFHWVVQYPCNN
jgi:hypothetical protein